MQFGPSDRHQRNNRDRVFPMGDNSMMSSSPISERDNMDPSGLLGPRSSVPSSSSVTHSHGSSSLMGHPHTSPSSSNARMSQPRQSQGSQSGIAGGGVAIQGLPPMQNPSQGSSSVPPP